MSNYEQYDVAAFVASGRDRDRVESGDRREAQELIVRFGLGAGGAL